MALLTMMVIQDPGKGPITSPWICPDVIQPRSTLIHQFGAARPAYGHNMTIYGHFGPFRGPMAPPNGHSGPGKGSQHIVPDVPGLDPTLIHADPPVWSRQACLWPQNYHLWPFWAVLRPYGAPNGHSRPGKGSQHIAPDVPGLDPTSIHADPPVWSCQACLWHNRAIYGLFEPFWDPMAGSTVKKSTK